MASSATRRVIVAPRNAYEYFQQLYSTDGTFRAEWDKLLEVAPAEADVLADARKLGCHSSELWKHVLMEQDHRHVIYKAFVSYRAGLPP
jgi:hypothetical protein